MKRESSNATRGQATGPGPGAFTERSGVFSIGLDGIKRQRLGTQSGASLVQAWGMGACGASDGVASAAFALRWPRVRNTAQEGWDDCPPWKRQFTAPNRAISVSIHTNPSWDTQGIASLHSHGPSSVPRGHPSGGLEPSRALKRMRCALH